MNSFESMGLEARLLRALQQEGYASPTPIQAQAIPHVLEGRDLLGIAQTGTGKTASFALPILQRLALNPRTPDPRTARALILSPTRELAAQIADSFRAYSRYMNVTITTIFGGVSENPQKQNMARGIDVLVATPGRLRDLVSQRAVELSKTEIFVLDEADRMLDMGFIADIRRIVKVLGPNRQNLFFSATMPEEIGRLAGELLTNPVRVSVTPPSTTVERIAQRVIHVSTADKRALLVHLLRSDESMARTLVFTRTKHGADKVVRALAAAGINASAIHGNKSQSQRVNALNNFRSGRAPVLVATDIAARGIDIDGISHVINFDLPHVPESYVHRIGRTARAGADGIAIAFCDREERALLRDIEKVTRQQIPASDWRAPPGEGLPTPGPVQTHEQKQEARRQQAPADRPQPRQPKPHRKGSNNPRHDILAHMAAQGQLPEVSVEPKSADGRFRGPRPAQRPGKPHGARPFGGEPRRHNDQRPDRRDTPRGEQRGDQRGEQRGEHRSDRPARQDGDRPFHKRNDGARSEPRGDHRADRPARQDGDRPFHKRNDRPQGPGQGGRARPGKFGKRPSARSF